MASPYANREETPLAEQAWKPGLSSLQLENDLPSQLNDSRPQGDGGGAKA